MTDLVSAANALRQFAGSDGSRALVGLLDALDTRYADQLVDVDAAGLPKLQAAIRQVRALRRVAVGHELVDGLI